ncbi:MAG TPA: tetratricopeptide repeat protein [Terriglobales bacterium]|nr:tetratricopeptide repeat protein [Terriglobales bacterium]
MSSATPIPRILLLFMLLSAFFCNAATTPGAELLASGKADEAVTVLQKAITQNPNDAASFNLLCRAYYSYGNWDQAISACEKSVAIDANNGLYHLWLGRAYGEKADNSSIFSAPGFAKKARNEFETAVRLNPENVEARSDLSEYYVEAPGMMGGGTDKAEAQAQALEKLFPAKAHWIRARIAEKKKDYTTAEKEYREAIQSHDNSGTWLDLASYFRHRDKLQEMEYAINRAVDGKVDPPEAMFEAAESLIRTGRNFSKAAELLRKYLNSGHLVEEAPAFKAHYQLGVVLEKQGDKKSAAQEYSAALALAKGFSRAKEALDRVNR